MELRDALMQITEIRQQVARTEVFRGYRSVPIALSGLLSLGAASMQWLFVPEPSQTPHLYICFWVILAGLSLVATGAEIFWRHHRTASPVARSLTWLAIEQFVPCVIAGGLLTLVLARWAVEAVWMLPGLWAMIFSLGIFASARLLPRPVILVAQYYLVAGLACLILARDEHAFSPWAMAGTFGIGQLLVALVFYWTLERNHDTTQE